MPPSQFLFLAWAEIFIFFVVSRLDLEPFLFLIQLVQGAERPGHKPDGGTPSSASVQNM
jgi:hypothetical protein